jgi:hypothetical protein
VTKPEKLNGNDQRHGADECRPAVLASGRDRNRHEHGDAGGHGQPGLFDRGLQHTSGSGLAPPVKEPWRECQSSDGDDERPVADRSPEIDVISRAIDECLGAETGERGDGEMGHDATSSNRVAAEQRQRLERLRERATHVGNPHAEDGDSPQDAHCCCSVLARTTPMRKGKKGQEEHRCADIALGFDPVRAVGPERWHLMR